MTKNELLLVQLMEECSEVAKRCSKALRFGLDEVQPGHFDTNAKRIRDELHDVISTALVLQSEGLLEDILPDGETVTSRAHRIARFAEYSRKRGCLIEDATPLIQRYM